MSARPITIMIIDDHVVIRSGLRMLIEHDQHMKVVAQAGSRTEALERAASTNPDVIILDLLLGDEDGLSFLPELCQASPNSRVLVLTGVQNPDAHRRAIRRGAMGIVLKEHAADKLLKAIMKVNEGEVWIERSMMGSMIQEFNKPAMVDPEVSKIESLTDREREVIALIGEGLKNKQVGERLFISETTVKTHVTHILQKLNLRDRVQAVVFAYRTGAFTDDGADGPGRA